MNIIYIPFTGVGIPGYGGDEWFKQRIELFKKYTLKSLENQSDKEFYLWVSFRPEEESNHLTWKLYSYLLNHSTLKHLPIFNFHGLMYHDDKFGGSFLYKTKNILRILRRSYKAKNMSILTTIPQVLKDKNKSLPDRLSRGLKELAQHIPKTEIVYMSRIDSDDMFNSDYIKRIKEASRIIGPEAFVVDMGFIYNESTQELARWNPKTNPPFHTIVFEDKSFLDPEKHLANYKGYKSHEDVIRLFDCCTMNNGLYCVLTHNPQLHISTTFTHPYRGDIITNNKQEILKQFGINAGDIDNST